MAKITIEKSCEEMKKFLEALIVNSDKFPGRNPEAQEHYDRAVALVKRAQTALSSASRGVIS